MGIEYEVRGTLKSGRGYYVLGGTHEDLGEAVSLCERMRSLNDRQDVYSHVGLYAREVGEWEELGDGAR